MVFGGQSKRDNNCYFGHHLEKTCEGGGDLRTNMVAPRILGEIR